DFKIELKQEVRTEKTVSTPMGGDLARGGVVGSAGTSSGDAVAAAYARQSVPVITILLHGEIVGEFVNSVLVPGLTFGWGPKGSKVVAYSAHKNGRVTIMDATGAKRDVDGSRDSLLPGFSPDGARVAWLQKDGKAFNLRIVALR